MARRIIAGLEVGTANIRLAINESLGRGRPPRVLALIKKPSRGLRRGYVLNVDEAAAAVREAIAEGEKTIKQKIKRVFLGLGGVTLESKMGEGQIIVARADTELGALDVTRAIEQSETTVANLVNSRVIHTIPIQFKLDGKKILGRPEGMRGSKLEVKTLFITCLSQHLTSLLRVTELAGLVVEDIIAAPVAAALTLLNQTQRAAGCLLANIGSQTTSIVVYEDGLPVALQVFPIGSTDITNDIALGLRVTLEEAERIKVGMESNVVTKKKLDEIIEARLGDMFELIDGQLKKIGKSGLLPAGLILTGGGSNVPGVEQLARQTLRLPARLAQSEDGDPVFRERIKDAAWAVAYGLCLFGQTADAEESLGWKIARRTRGTFLQWLKELLP